MVIASMLFLHQIFVVTFLNLEQKKQYHILKYYLKGGGSVILMSQFIPV